jgi:hypothetical protein
VVEAVSAITGRTDTIASNVEGKGIVHPDFISRICEHRRKKSSCKVCGGSSICDHGREKNKCKECGGNGICDHGRRKVNCKECGGSGLCIHDKVKYTCVKCKRIKRWVDIFGLTI